MQAKLLLTSFLVMSVVEQQTVNANTEDSLEIWAKRYGAHELVKLAVILTFYMRRKISQWI